jgi:hypothetical protein
MDRFELVEKLVKSTGVSFAEAKKALEASGWDLLDAAVWLEKNGAAEEKTSHFTTNPEQQEEQRRQQEEERRREERRKEAARNSAASQNTGGRGVFQTVLRKAKEIIMDNELIICKRSGEVFLEIPIWLFIILLIVAFWPTAIVLVLVFIIGFRFRLHGPDLGSEKVNNILNKAESAAGDFIDRIKTQNSNQHKGYYDATRGPAQTRDDDVIDYNEPPRKE